MKRNTIRTRAVWGGDAVDGVFLLVHIGHRLRNPLNESVHWGEKRRMREKFQKAVRETDRPLAVRTLTFVRWYPPRSKPFDSGDNLNAGFKWFRDEACKWLGTDDGPDCGLAFEYEQYESDAYGVTVRFQ